MIVEGFGAGFEAARGKGRPDLQTPLLSATLTAERQEGSGVRKAARGRLDGFIVALAKGGGGRLSDARLIEHRFRGGRFRLRLVSRNRGSAFRP